MKIILKKEAHISAALKMPQKLVADRLSNQSNTQSAVLESGLYGANQMQCRCNQAKINLPKIGSLSISSPEAQIAITLTRSMNILKNNNSSNSIH
jgi:hypothetical protein